MNKGRISRREIRPAEDRLLIRAIAQVLKPVFGDALPKDCVHPAGNGGLKATVAQVEDYISQHPDHGVLQALRVAMHPDKTFIGKVSKGFDFLGFHLTPTGVTVSDTALSRHEQKVGRFYERSQSGASKKRIRAYRLRWLAWATFAGVTNASASIELDVPVKVYGECAVAGTMLTHPFYRNGRARVSSVEYLCPQTAPSSCVTPPHSATMIADTSFNPVRARTYRFTDFKTHPSLFPTSLLGLSPRWG